MQRIGILYQLKLIIVTLFHCQLEMVLSLSCTTIGRNIVTLTRNLNVEKKKLLWVGNETSSCKKIYWHQTSYLQLRLKKLRT